MDAGKLNTKIVIQSRNTIIANGKKTTTDWTQYYSTWCSVLDLIGKEKYEAYNAKLENSLKFKVRVCNKLKDMYKNIMKKDGIEFRILLYDIPFSIVFLDTLGNDKQYMLLQGKAVN